VYTDLAVGLKGVGGAFGVGLQPTIGLVRSDDHLRASGLFLQRVFATSRRQHAFPSSHSRPCKTTCCSSFMGLQVAAAGKRMGPNDPDKSRPKPEKLPW
jgi:hypothetical protein